MPGVTGSLLPVIVGGLIAIAGGAVTSVMLHFMRIKAEKRRRQSEKFEELVATVYEYGHWLEKVRDIRVFGREGEPTLSPLAKLQSISSVYFPQFEAKIKELEIAARNYEAWMLAEAAKRLSGEPLPLTVQNFADAYGPFQSKANDLLHDLSEHAKREFQ